MDVCRAGLAIHPGYLSARVTLGRAFLELNQLDEAQAELEQVLKSATENLAAIRGLAEVHQRRGHLAEALVQYRAALSLARNDPDLEQTVDELTRQLAPKKGPETANGLSFAQMQQALLTHQPPASAAVAPSAATGGQAPASAAVAPSAATARQAPDLAPAVVEPPAPIMAPVELTPVELTLVELTPVEMMAPVEIDLPIVENPGRERALRTIDALQQFLDRIHVAGAERHA